MLESRVQIVNRLTNHAQLLYVFLLKAILERATYLIRTRLERTTEPTERVRNHQRLKHWEYLMVPRLNVCVCTIVPPWIGGGEFWNHEYDIHACCCVCLPRRSVASVSATDTGMQLIHGMW